VVSKAGWELWKFNGDSWWDWLLMRQSLTGGERTMAKTFLAKAFSPTEKLGSRQISTKLKKHRTIC